MRQGPQKVLTGSALASRVAQFGMRSMIKSIQTGTITTAGTAASGTATITAVNLSTTLLIYNGYSISGGGTYGQSLHRIDLTNSTTVTANRGAVGGGYVGISSFAVIEFLPGLLKSIQSGTMTSGAGATTATATITAVNTQKSFSIELGFTATYAGGSFAYPYYTELTNATTVTTNVTTGLPGGNVWISGFTVAELY